MLAYRLKKDMHNQISKMSNGIKVVFFTAEKEVVTTLILCKENVFDHGELLVFHMFFRVVTVSRKKIARTPFAAREDKIDPI